MTTPSDPLARLVAEWRSIAKAQDTSAETDAFDETEEAQHRVAGAIYRRCADDLEQAAHDTAQPGAGCNCKSANNPAGTTEPVLFTSETGKVYGVDACIAPVITELHRLGMPTRASCCGHGIQPPSVIMETDMDHYDCLRLLKRIDHRLWSVERVRP